MKHWTWIALLAIGWLNIADGFAADVDADVSTRETIVGLPVILSIQITNSVDHDPPEFPEVDGLEIERAGAPSRSTQVSIVNGRRTERSNIVYRFRITPLREGTFTIPPVRVSADGISRITRAVRIIATKGETNDLLFVEVEGNAKQIYVGQPLKLKLKIWVRPYRDADLRVRLSEGEMWNQISQQSSWGNFQTIFEELEANRQRPGGRSVLRKDSTGAEREYYLYEVETTVYPDRPGKIDGGNVRVLVQYPQQLGRSRSPFSAFDDDDFFGPNSPFGDSFFDDRIFGGRGYSITAAKPIVGEAVVDPIDVRPVPEQGRPDDYRGAVGEYSIRTEATPTKVKVGDPITLKIIIESNGRLDVVRAPPIETQSDLISGFKVPDEPLAGMVDRGRKVFTTSIRPRTTDVTEIPGIEFSYFDPQQEKFVTARSDPIAIEVEPADVLTLDSIVGAGRSRNRTNSPDQISSQSDPSVADAEPEFPVLRTDGALEPTSPASIVTPAAIATLAAGPMLALIVLLVRSRTTFARLIPPRRRLLQSLRRAKAPGEIADAVEEYLASRFQLPDNRVRRNQTIGKLRAAGQFDLAVRLERFYSACEQSHRRDDADTVDSLRRDAIQISDEASTAPRFRLASLVGRAAVWTAFFLGTSGANAANEIELTDQQRSMLLAEALPIDPSLSGEALERQLAETQRALQMIVDSGVQNDRLFFNLASVAHRRGDLAVAVANYRRALRLNPTETEYHRWWKKAELDLRPQAFDSSDMTIRAAEQAILWIPPRWSAMVFVFAWFAFWIVIVLRLVRLRFAWKTAAAFCLLCAVLAGWSYMIPVRRFVADDQVVLVRDAVIVRQGDGDEFESVAELQNATGRVVQRRAERGQWIQVELPSGTVGWIHRDTGVVI